MDWNPKTQAILLFAHGSRSPDLKDELGRVCQLVRERTGLKIVEMSFLELTEPDLFFGIKSCAEQGAKEITVVPYLLSVGRHVGKDLPQRIAEAYESFPEVKIRLAPHLGVDPLLAELVEQRAGQAQEIEKMA